MTINFEALAAQPSMPDRLPHQNADANRNRWLSQLDQALFSESGKEQLASAAPYAFAPGRDATTQGSGEASAGAPVRGNLPHAAPSNPASPVWPDAARLPGQGQGLAQVFTKAQASGTAQSASTRLPGSAVVGAGSRDGAATSFFPARPDVASDPAQATVAPAGGNAAVLSSATSSGNVSTASGEGDISPTRSSVAPMENAGSAAWSPAWQAAPTAPSAVGNFAYGGLIAPSTESITTVAVTVPAPTAAANGEPTRVLTASVEDGDVELAHEIQETSKPQVPDQYDERLMHVSQDDDGVHAWIRDAAIGAGQLPALTLAMASELGAAGTPLAGLTVNGRRIELPRAPKPPGSHAGEDEFVTDSTTGTYVTSIDIQGAL